MRNAHLAFGVEKLDPMWREPQFQRLTGSDVHTVPQGYLKVTCADPGGNHSFRAGWFLDDHARGNAA